MIQLLDNLVINTISYCKEGRITITLNQDRNHVRLSLSDEGIGIPKEELYEVFEPFTVSSITRTPAGGRGVSALLFANVFWKFMAVLLKLKVTEKREQLLR